MRYLLFYLLFLTNILFAQTTVQIAKGWQLMGLPEQLNDMRLFNHKDVQIIWSFDAAAQSWLGYASDSTVQTKITDAGYGQLSSLKPWQAFWILSNNTWTAALHTDSAIPTDPLNTHLELYRGWNLISLPSKTVVSADFFDEMTVWKYSDEWQVHSNTSLPFPSINEISVSEGLWVKSTEDQTIDLNEKASKLHTFESEEAMLEYIRSMVKNHRYPYYGYIDDWSIITPGDNTDFSSDGFSDPQTTIETVSDATSTNLQEEGVDESDILKHDGQHIFFVDQENARINITSFTNISAGEYTPLQQITLESGQNVSAMYLQNNRLSVISKKYEYHILEGDPQKFHLDIYDVSDINTIKLLTSTSIEGDYRESRMIQGKLILISHFYPQITYEYPTVYPPTTLCEDLRVQMNTIAETTIVGCDFGYCNLPDTPEYREYKALAQDYTDERCYQYNYDENGKAWKYDYENPIIVSEHLTPKMSTKDKVVELLQPKTFYAPYKMDQNADITTISTIDTADGNYLESISFLGSTHTYYASLTSLYLVSRQYPIYYHFDQYREQQTVYQFNIDGALSYTGRGFVDGRMLSQYSMSEYGGALRIATTSGNSWSTIGTDNALFILKSNQNEALEIIGELHGLGKENETIHAVRFIGDRGYVVTFRRTDPFYTLDLKDPTAPVVAGALMIPGFSEYIHPIDENRILSIGRDADSSGRATGLQIQLFDISDFTTPILTDKIIIGDNRTYSEAEYNPKVFAYRSSDNMFGLPYRKDYRDFYFGLYQINGLRIDSIADLYEQSTEQWGYASPRGIIFDLNAATYGALFQGDHIICETITPKAL